MYVPLLNCILTKFYIYLLRIKCIVHRLFIFIHLSSTKPPGDVLRRVARQLVGSVSLWRAILKDKSEKPQIFPREYTLSSN